ncbi:54S ribosomal protein, mitochondrial [Agyrium rufum]|nr:54S ribosomal protein, mitochondrial [Agyrium rufum]
MARSLRLVAGSCNQFQLFGDPLMQCLAPRLSRAMATEVPLPRSSISKVAPVEFIHAITPERSPVLATIYNFPSMEPLRFQSYSADYLHLPLRRDILHRAVIFEGDGTRQGTASTKWRDDVHGSGRKIRPQKGTGKARLGDKKSPMLRGGGVAFGPHPRDFSTKLPRKIYDLAWRTALSYRYRRGELVIVEDGVELSARQQPRWIKKIMEANGWGNADGRSMIVTADTRHKLFEALQRYGEDGIAKTEDDVDVKDLLEMGRIIIEKGSLDRLLRSHTSDLNRKVPKAKYPQLAEEVVQV